MATTAVRTDVPFYFSSAGSNDEAYIEHDGSDLYLKNDTGVFNVGDKLGNYYLTVDIPNMKVGINNTTPNYELEVYAPDSNVTAATNRASGATVKMSSRLTVGHVGTVTAHDLEIKTSNNTVCTFNTSGDIQVLAAYSTVIGGVNTDLYIDNTGLMGPNPSSIRFKENIRDCTDTSWIHNLKVRIADYKNGGPQNKICLIAEECEPVQPTLVRYAYYKKEPDASYKQIKTSEFLNIKELNFSPNEEKTVQLTRIKKDSKGDEIIIDGQEVTEDIEMTVKALPQSVNLSDLIIPMLFEIQNLRKEIEILRKV